MVDRGVEDDGYSDEDLDALPVNALQKLQEDALRHTQQPRSSLPHVLSRAIRQPTPDLGGGFGRLSVGVETTAHQIRSHEPSSDYGNFDDELLDGEILDGAEPSLPNEQGLVISPFGESTQREQWRWQRYGSLSHAATIHSPHPPQFDDGLSARNTTKAGNVASPMRALSNVEQKAAPTLSEVGSLQAQVKRLLREREELRIAALNAKDSAFAKAGEIAMVRAKILKAEQDFDIRKTAQQRLHADESARYKIELERAQAEIQNITTEKAFLENELAEGTKQLRQVQKTIKKDGSTSVDPVEPARESLPTTPKKLKNLPYADGFDNDEFQVLSPSKLALRGKTSTPKAGTKRKRKIAGEIPVHPQALELGETSGCKSKDNVQQESASKHGGSFSSPTRWDLDLQFIQKVLNHRLERSQERTIEALSRFALPSQPEKAFSTMIYDQVLVLIGGAQAENLPATVGLIVISLWSQCIKEHYHLPVHLLIDLVEFVIFAAPVKTAPELTNSLMDLVQETADIRIIPRCQKKPPRQDGGKITSLACLRVIKMMAQDCSIATEEITRFWRTMRFDFTMMLLSFLHPLEEIHIAVALLRTSVLKNSFAMIIPQGDGKQDASEAHVIDNLSRLLVESPRITQCELHLDTLQLSKLRLQVLGLLDTMCERRYCAEALAKHRLVIGRLVRVMNDELDKAYDYAYGYEQHIALVNDATNLLYFLITNYAPLIDMQARLSVIPGGEQKYLIALTRLAFSEGSLLEEDIRDEVVDEAHQLLEMKVSPEEADQLVSAFASSQSTRRVSKEPS